MKPAIIFALAATAIAGCSPNSPGREIQNVPVSEAADDGAVVSAATAPIAEANETAGVSTEDAGASSCNLTSQDMLALGCKPSDLASCIDPETNEPYCLVQDLMHDIHERDPAFAAGLALLQEPEVLGGKLVKVHQYLETVLITPGPSISRPICSGVLIHPQVVLTAGHCVVDEPVVAKEDAVVTFGRSLAEPLHQANVAGVVTEFTTNEDPASRDLALVWLKEAVPNSFPVARIATDAESGAALPQALAEIASRDDVRSTQQGAARVVGFGLNEQKRSGAKRAADLIVVASDCDGSVTDKRTGRVVPHEEFYACNAGLELVAGRAKAEPVYGVDTCNGDSGGPIFVVPQGEGVSRERYLSAIAQGEPDQEIEYRLAGITSRAIQSDYIRQRTDHGIKCGNGGVYERISEDNLKWIQDEMLPLGFSLELAGE